jgi:hypothetical protein
LNSDDPSASPELRRRCGFDVTTRRCSRRG